MKGLLLLAVLARAQGPDCRPPYEADSVCGRQEKRDRDRAVVKQFLPIPIDQLAPEERQALADVDPDNLPAKQKKSYLAWREDVLQQRLGAPPGRSHCTKASDQETKRKVAVLGHAGYDEIKWDECEWLSGLTECSFDEMKRAFAFDMVYDCKLFRYRCFLIPKEPVYAYIGIYRKGGRTKADVAGTQFFGIGNQPLGCKNGTLDDKLKGMDARP